jgi:hypothetical protein
MLYQLSYTPRPWRDLCGERQRRKAAGSIYDFSKRSDHERGRPSDQDKATALKMPPLSEVGVPYVAVQAAMSNGWISPER